MERGSGSKSGKGKSVAENAEISSVAVERNESYSYNCMHPGCTMKMHAQRLSPDLDQLIIQYEGEHNHAFSLPHGQHLSFPGQGHHFGVDFQQLAIQLKPAHTINYGPSSCTLSFPRLQTYPCVRAAGGHGRSHQALVPSAHGVRLHVSRRINLHAQVPRRTYLSAPVVQEIHHHHHHQSFLCSSGCYNFMDLPDEQPSSSNAQENQFPGEQREQASSSMANGTGSPLIQSSSNAQCSHGLLQLHQSAFGSSRYHNFMGLPDEHTSSSNAQENEQASSSSQLIHSSNVSSPQEQSSSSAVINTSDVEDSISGLDLKLGR